MLEINFCYLFTAGPAGLKFTGPSAKLLITYIIFIFVFWMYAICVCKLINETVFPIREFSTKLREHFVFLSIKSQPFVFITAFHASGNLRVVLVGAGVSDAVLISLSSAFLSFFKTFAFGNSSFVSRLLALFGTIRKKYM